MLFRIRCIVFYSQKQPEEELLFVDVNVTVQNYYVFTEGSGNQHHPMPMQPGAEGNLGRRCPSTDLTKPCQNEQNGVLTITMLYLKTNRTDAWERPPSPLVVGIGLSLTTHVGHILSVPISFYEVSCEDRRFRPKIPNPQRASVFVVCASVYR